MWNYDYYKNWVKSRLNEIRVGLGFSEYQIEVFNEQDYAKKSSLNPKTITMVIKYLPSSMIINAKTQPIQMIVFAEENKMSIANSIITKFTEDFNFVVSNDDKTYTKHIYETPSVLSNFEMIGVGLRTVFYIGATLIILEDVMDINNLTVLLDGGEESISLDPMSATVGYTMAVDTQAFDGGYAKSEKQFATLVMTLNVACVENDFTKEIVKIMANATIKKGNENFTFSWTIGDISFSSFVFKLTGATFTTAKNNVPSIQMSFSM